MLSTLIQVSVGYDTSLGVVTFFKSENYQQDVFDVKNNYEYLEEIPPQSAPATDRIWALVELECPVVCPKDSMFIASKLDVDPSNSHSCKLLTILPTREETMSFGISWKFDLCAY